MSACWADSWHQQPDLMTLTGRRMGDTLELSAQYAGEWGWQISLRLHGERVSMTMRNGIPRSAVSQAPPDAPTMQVGPYDVMVAAWSTP